MYSVDLFAGVGGATIGTLLAGARVLAAANHWPLAIEYHSKNHPEVEHICQDLQQLNWAEVPAHDLLWASPSCIGHTKARGKEKKHHDEARSTAWAVVSCAEYHRPNFVIVENVQEFLKWELYKPWLYAMKTLGYSHSESILNSADFGVPQERIRLFVIFSKSEHPFKFRPPRRKHQPASSIINWGHTMSDIYKPDRSPKTISIVEKSREELGDTFVFPYYGTTALGKPMSRPLGTVTTRDRWGLVCGDKMRMLQVDEYKRAMGFPTNYILPNVRKDAIHLLGNGVVPKKPEEIIKQIYRRG
jgi:DNA (cytosine-5)-methyltransferase 1